MVGWLVDAEFPENGGPFCRSGAFFAIVCISVWSPSCNNKQLKSRKGPMSMGHTPSIHCEERTRGEIEKSSS